MSRLEAWASRTEKRIWQSLPVVPYWHGPVKNKRWRLVMAYRALRGYELGGFNERHR